MGRFIIGGFGAGDVNFNIDDRQCRAIQHAVFTRLGEGNGMYFRYAGVKDSGAEVVSTVWIGQSTAFRFEFDGDVLPELDQELATAYRHQVDNIGGIVLPSAAEVATWDEAEAASSEADAALE